MPNLKSPCIPYTLKPWPTLPSEGKENNDDENKNKLENDVSNFCCVTMSWNKYLPEVQYLFY